MCLVIAVCLQRRGRSGMVQASLVSAISITTALQKCKMFQKAAAKMSHLRTGAPKFCVYETRRNGEGCSRVQDGKPKSHLRSIHNTQPTTAFRQAKYSSGRNKTSLGNYKRAWPPSKEQKISIYTSSSLPALFHFAKCNKKNGSAAGARQVVHRPRARAARCLRAGKSLCCQCAAPQRRLDVAAT
eukprot:6206413-Pleurochrysis_carterae.AAC.2